jgi:hypothetical protein
MIAYFKILNLPIRIESNSPQFLQHVGNIFHYFKVSRPNPDVNDGASFCVSIDQTSTITFGNDIIYRSPHYRYILEYLEYKIYTLLINRLSDYYLIHAGVVAHDDKAIVLPGSSGGGKTTLIAGLLKNGFRYLTDEIGIIDPHTLRVYPFPKPLNMKIGSLSLFDNFEPEMELINKKDVNIEGKIHHVLVKSSSIHAMDKPVPVRDIIFVRYDPGGKSRLTSISRANAIFDLAKCSFNHYRFKEKGIEMLESLVRGSQCYQLRFAQIGEAVGLLKKL